MLTSLLAVPPVVTVVGPAVVEAGDRATLRCSVAAEPAPSLTWQRAGARIGVGPRHTSGWEGGGQGGPAPRTHILTITALTDQGCN